MSKILLAEDDENLGYILKEYLEINSFQVRLARDGEEGLNFFQKENFDLCILDVMMPKKDGFTLATDIKRQNKEIPIIFLTAKSLKVDKLKGFKIGADDYIVKPVDEEELIARIHAILKRTTNEDVSEDIYEIGSYHFDPSRQSLRYGEEETTLTTKEAQILEALCQNRGTIMDRDITLKRLWGNNDYFNRRSMDVFISRLRKYLSKDARIIIRNVHGKGFILEIK